LIWAYVVHALAEALPERLRESRRLIEIGADPGKSSSRGW
jgi:hypothetical protein